MSVLDKNISCFQNYWTKTGPADVNLVKWLTSAKYAEKVKYIRGCDDAAEIKALKASLPAITVSGKFSVRNMKGLIQHSGLMCIDIDPGHNPNIVNWGEVKEVLSQLDNVAYCGLSVSGNGYFAIVPIAYPAKHTEHFKALEADFLRMGLVIDPNCKDVCRLRGYSYDPAPYFNHAARTYYRTFDPDKPRQRRHSDGWKPTGSKFDRAERFARKHYPGGYIDGQRHNFRAFLSIALNKLGVPLDEAAAYIETNYPTDNRYNGNSVTGPYGLYGTQHGEWE
ncbi:MAG: hypothetical protein J5I98_01260 [Phaeodactylibacter sp.]|nr:hypothetical protein [Phaeodactylibacter sp.]